MLTIANRQFSSRLFLGTGKFGDTAQMVETVRASSSELVTVAMKRLQLNQPSDDILEPLKSLGVALLPNTSGARTAKEAVFAACMARDALETVWIKVEIHPDQRYLMPDPIETLKACTELVQQGFVVMPYCHADPVLCKKLEDVGCASVMPLGAPIGSHQGLQTRDFLQIIIEQSNVPVVIDAGIGRPSDAVLAMELGADAVLINTAIATANHPVIMGAAFRQAVIAGRMAWEGGGCFQSQRARASSPLTAFQDILA